MSNYVDTEWAQTLGSVMSVRQFNQFYRCLGHILGIRDIMVSLQGKEGIVGRIGDLLLDVVGLPTVTKLKSPLLGSPLTVKGRTLVENADRLFTVSAKGNDDVYFETPITSTVAGTTENLHVSLHKNTGGRLGRSHLVLGENEGVGNIHQLDILFRRQGVGVGSNRRGVIYVMAQTTGSANVSGNIFSSNDPQILSLITEILNTLSKEINYVDAILFNLFSLGLASNPASGPTNLVVSNVEDMIHLLPRTLVPVQFSVGLIGATVGIAFRRFIVDKNDSFPLGTLPVFDESERQVPFGKDFKGGPKKSTKIRLVAFPKVTETITIEAFARLNRGVTPLVLVATIGPPLLEKADLAAAMALWEVEDTRFKALVTSTKADMKAIEEAPRGILLDDSSSLLILKPYMSLKYLTTAFFAPTSTLLSTG